MTYSTTLDGAISADQTEVYVDDLPTSPIPLIIQVGSELMALDWVHGDFVTPVDPTKRIRLGVARGVSGTARATHADAAAVTGGEAGIAGTIVAPAGAENTSDLVFEVQGETGRTLLSVDPYGSVNIKGAIVDPSNGGASLIVFNTVPVPVHVLIGDDGNGNPTAGFFKSGATAQPNLPDTPDAQDIADALIALGLASQVSVALTGTALAGGVLESEMVTGGETIIITLTGATWSGSVGGDDQTNQTLLDGMVSAESEPNGWNASNIDATMTAVVRSSDTIVTVTLQALAAYAITADEHITVTVPAALLVGTTVAKVASPVITVTANA